MDTNRIPKQALQYKPKGRRHIGRPRKRWRDQFHFDDTRNRNQTILPEHDDDDDKTSTYSMSQHDGLRKSEKKVGISSLRAGDSNQGPT